MSVQFERLYEQIVDDIEQRVLDGKLKVGDKLPSERELCEEFGVSRTAVREAIKALSEKGLVRSHTGRGTFITDGASQAMSNSFGLVAKMSGDAGLTYLAELRVILEPEIAALAAVRANDEQRTDLSRLVSAMDTALSEMDVDEFMRNDFEFHLALATATCNQLFSALIDSLVDLLYEQRRRGIHRPGVIQRAQEAHHRILNAILARDPVAARQAMRAHLQPALDDALADLS